LAVQIDQDFAVLARFVLFRPLLADGFDTGLRLDVFETVPSRKLPPLPIGFRPIALNAHSHRFLVYLFADSVKLPQRLWFTLFVHNSTNSPSALRPSEIQEVGMLLTTPRNPAA
jgi:hypothetical protein